MARRQSTFGKKPGGMFKGIPGNFGVQKGFGDAFKKMGDWGVLNSREWIGFGKRQGVSDARPRDQFELQQVISENLSIEAEISKQRAEAARQRTAPATTIPATPPGQQPRRTPSPGTTPAPAGTKPTPTPKAPPKATPAAAKANPDSAAVKAMKNPVKRGR